MTNISKLKFTPFPGLTSKHLQMIIASYLPSGNAPPSKVQTVKLEDHNFLSCQISTPFYWKKTDETVVLVHGMGGSHTSNYMVRLSNKLYNKGKKVVRINLRGCGSGANLSKLPYHAGTSHDILCVLKFLKSESPFSEISILGFSLGGNIILKLAGELGVEAEKFVRKFIAVCPPLDLAQTVGLIQEKGNRLYHSYYLKKISQQATTWVSKNPESLFEFDDLITAPLWGYKGASDYYQSCSSINFLPKIGQSTHVLFAEDDPFICLKNLPELSLPSLVKVWLTEKGSHMGFLGKSASHDGPYWMDSLLLNLVDANFV